MTKKACVQSCPAESTSKPWDVWRELVAGGGAVDEELRRGWSVVGSASNGEPIKENRARRKSSSRFHFQSQIRLPSPTSDAVVLAEKIQPHSAVRVRSFPSPP